MFLARAPGSGLENESEYAHRLCFRTAVNFLPSRHGNLRAEIEHIIRTIFKVLIALSTMIAPVGWIEIDVARP